MRVEFSEQQVLQEIQKMANRCIANGARPRAIGIDTLAMMFNISMDEILPVLNSLQSQGIIEVNISPTYQSTPARSKRKVMGSVLLITHTGSPE
jgi:hypothetical protein